VPAQSKIALHALGADDMKKRHASGVHDTFETLALRSIQRHNFALAGGIDCIQQTPSPRMKNGFGKGDDGGGGAGPYVAPHLSIGYPRRSKIGNASLPSDDRIRPSEYFW
jgi:hypothetical protein